MKQNILLFGGTGGLGSQVASALNSPYKVVALGSKDCNLMSTVEIESFCDNCKPEPDIILFFNALNINGFLHKQSVHEIDDLIKANITGVTQATALFLEGMRKRGYGRLIYASSVTVDKSIMGTAIYAATKAYYENLVKTIALENGSKGITANCIQLGYMNGGLTYTLPKEFLANKIQEIPSRRLGTVSEICEAIKYLIENEYMNGSTIKLTGGL